MKANFSQEANHGIWWDTSEQEECVFWRDYMYAELGFSFDDLRDKKY